MIIANSGLLTGRTDALNHTTSYEHNARGNLSKEIDPLGHATTYIYDANGNRTEEQRTRTLSGGGSETLITRFEYDNNNRLEKTIYPDGTTTRTIYNAIGKQAQTIDALNRTTDYQYDTQGRLIQTTYPDTTTESSAYDAEGRRISSTDRAKRVTTYTYDALGRLTETTYPDLTKTKTSYDVAGQVVSTIDALDQVTRYQYDLAGRRTKVIDATNTQTTPACGSAGVTCFGYDAAGNQTQVTDANNQTTQFVYDNANRRTKVIYPDNSTDQTAYDALGRQTGKTDQATVTTQFTYDALGRLLKVTDALNQETSYGYDELGQQISQTDANQNTTTFEYDSMGRRIGRALPLGQTESFQYDEAGNPVSHTDFNGKTTAFTYDAVNRPVTKTPDPSFAAPQVNFTYTASGQRESMTDASGTTDYIYDSRDRLTGNDTPRGSLIYTYELTGNLASIRSSHIDGVSIDYTYDALNRLATVTDNNLVNGVTDYHYDAVGNLAGYDYPNGTATTYTYNSLNRLTDMSVDNTGTALARYTYTLGPTGNRLSVAELGGRGVAYAYDTLYRLKQETITGGTSNGQVDYVYDPVGNRLSRTSTLPAVANQSFTYDANDRLNTDTYDANGNTTGTSGKTYAYDFENKLSSQNGTQVGIVYDGDGNRVAETVGGVTTEYLVDTLNPTGYAQVLEEIVSGQVAVRYTYGSDLISQSRKAGSTWDTHFYGYDGHGSVRLLTDVNGQVTDRYDYEGFGTLVGGTGTTANKYLYSGEQRDGNLGFYYLRARWLNQGQGRFNTADMYLGDDYDPKSMQSYLYAVDDPVNMTDPSGYVGLPDAYAPAAILRNGLSIVEVRFGGFRGGAKRRFSQIRLQGRKLKPPVGVVLPNLPHNHIAIRVELSEADRQKLSPSVRSVNGTNGSHTITLGGYGPNSANGHKGLWGEANEPSDVYPSQPICSSHLSLSFTNLQNVEALYKLNDSYVDDSLPYFFAPEVAHLVPGLPNKDYYNSAGYVSGLLTAAGIPEDQFTGTCAFKSFPGWSKPVPTAYFQ